MIPSPPTAARNSAIWLAVSTLLNSLREDGPRWREQHGVVRKLAATELDLHLQQGRAQALAVRIEGQRTRDTQVIRPLQNKIQCPQMGQGIPDDWPADQV